jgi:quercetin dioxygenase-like cupin family protein
MGIFRTTSLSLLVSIWLSPAFADTTVVNTDEAVPGKVSLSTLLSGELERVEGTEFIVSRVDLPPNTSLPTHWHPGEEFGYVLKGRVIMTLEGKGDAEYGEGELAKVPLKHVHAASTGDEGAELLVFRVHEKGQPERVLVKKAAD